MGVEPTKNMINTIIEKFNKGKTKMKVKVKIDVEKIVRDELEEAINRTYDEKIRLLQEESLKQYQIRDLQFNQIMLRNLISVYDYYSTDGNKFSFMLEDTDDM